MDEVVLADDMKVRQRFEECSVVLRHDHDAIVVGIGRKRCAPSVVDEARHAARVRAVEELPEHELVVAQEAHHLAVVAELQDGIDHAARIGTAIDVVTKENHQRVALQRELLDQRPEFAGAAVNVANSEHASLACFRTPSHPLCIHAMTAA
jgi:hypothetical protein